ncbi:MAG: hypothetical protein ACTHOU_02785, partial [Aureliella sp.]
DKSGDSGLREIRRVEQENHHHQIRLGTAGPLPKGLSMQLGIFVWRAIVETMTLNELIERHGHECEIVPRSVHSRHGDFIAIIFANDVYYTERVDDLLTIHLSCESRQLVGCTIKGLSLLSQELSRHLTVEVEEVTLDIVLMAMINVQKDVDLTMYLRTAREGVRIPKRFFEPVGS